MLNSVVDSFSSVLEVIVHMQNLYEYPFRAEISQAEFIKYVLTAAAVCFVVTRMQLTFAFATAAVLAIIVIYFWHERTRSLEGSRYKTWTDSISRLDMITQHTHPFMYTEPQLIEFFISNLDLRKYAEDSFDKCLKSTDTFLRLQYEIQMGSHRCKFDIDTAHDLYAEILNRFSEMHFKLPDSRLRDRQEVAVEVLQKVLIRVMGDMRSYCKTDTDSLLAPMASDLNNLSLHQAYG